MAGSETDGRKAALTAATIVAVGMIAQQVAAKAARDAFFLSEFPATALPTVVIAGAAVSLIVVLVMTRAMTRWGPARVVPVVFGASGVLFLAVVLVCTVGRWIVETSCRIVQTVVEVSCLIGRRIVGLGCWIIDRRWRGRR